VPHPRTLGIIRECGGKAHLQDHNWTKAYEDFWEAFKNYDEGTQPTNQPTLIFFIITTFGLCTRNNDLRPCYAQLAARGGSGA
jgi:COP9 signalosome complex subunit 2